MDLFYYYFFIIIIFQVFGLYYVNLLNYHLLKQIDVNFFGMKMKILNDGLLIVFNKKS